MNGVFGIFGLAGSLCLLGLSSRFPLRGAIEVAWGVELHPGELYGAAVARAYELESEIAEYPRIVVGPEARKLLLAHAQNKNKDLYAQNDAEQAKLCLNMLSQDERGNWFLHYLGEGFKRAVTQGLHVELYTSARKFVYEQRERFAVAQNDKLASRYDKLRCYFDANAPAV